MRSHFISGAAVACAVAGASTLMMDGNCSAQNLIAADYATNATYGSGWSAGQNGGYGFGAWSFNGTFDTSDNPDPGGQQTMSSASSIGIAWTLFNLGSMPAGSGISNVGRAITEPGGLKPGQTFETVIQNPTAYHNYGGFDILFYNGTDNDPAGDNTAALRTLVFNYFVTTWKVVDNSGTTPAPFNAATTGVAGMKFDFTLTSTNTYSVTLTPLSNPSAAFTHTGTLVTTNLPINWVNYRLWNGQSSGTNDLAENFEISSMTITGLTLNIQIAGPNAVLSWPTNAFGLKLASSLNLGPTAVWNTNLPSPVVVSGLNLVTNPVSNVRQFYRLQQ